MKVRTEGWVLFLCSIIIFIIAESCASLKNVDTGDQTKRSLPATGCLPILPSDKASDAFRSDSFEVEAMKIEDQCLEVMVRYAGGCGSYALALFLPPNDSALAHDETVIHAVFRDEDPCRSMVHDSILFDLSVFESAARAGGIRLRIAGSEQSVFFAWPLH